MRRELARSACKDGSRSRGELLNNVAESVVRQENTGMDDVRSEPTSAEREQSSPPGSCLVYSSLDWTHAMMPRKCGM